MVNSSLYLMLQEFNILSALTKQELESLSMISELKRYDKGSTIYDTGDDKRYVYLVKKGCIKLGLTSSNGKSLIKDIIYDNSLFGENIFSGEKFRKASAITMDESFLIKIPAEKFYQLIQSNFRFTESIMNLTIKRLATLENRVQAFVFKKAERRIVDFVKALGETRGNKIEKDEILLQHKMSHKEIAKYTDTSRQTVARVFGELKKENLIYFSTRRPNKIIIRDIKMLA